jgi:hypothetical protein
MQPCRHWNTHKSKRWITETSRVHTVRDAQCQGTLILCSSLSFSFWALFSFLFAPHPNFQGQLLHHWTLLRLILVSILIGRWSSTLPAFHSTVKCIHFASFRHCEPCVQTGLLWHRTYRYVNTGVLELDIIFRVNPRRAATHSVFINKLKILIWRNSSD